MNQHLGEGRKSRWTPNQQQSCRRHLKPRLVSATAFALRGATRRTSQCSRPNTRRCAPLVRVVKHNLNSARFDEVWVFPHSARKTPHHTRESATEVLAGNLYKQRGWNRDVAAVVVQSNPVCISLGPGEHASQLPPSTTTGLQSPASVRQKTRSPSVGLGDRCPFFCLPYLTCFWFLYPRTHIKACSRASVGTAPPPQDYRGSSSQDRESGPAIPTYIHIYITQQSE